eukprot:1580737-Lingulodinium_polyedra.AAC.1
MPECHTGPIPTQISNSERRKSYPTFQNSKYLIKCWPGAAWVLHGCWLRAAYALCGCCFGAAR